jgi:hypothetical protein
MLGEATDDKRCAAGRMRLPEERKMTVKPINLLSDAHQDLLCFLVVTAAASYTLTQDWRVDHVVESCRLWLRRNGVALSWLQRVLLGQLALRIARRDLRCAGIAVRQAHVLSLFTADMGLNMSSTLVQRTREVCGNALREYRAA